MKTEFGLFEALWIRRVGLAMLLCFLLAMLAASVEAQQIISDQGVCNGALAETDDVPYLGDATGCGAVITVTSVDGTGKANAFTVTIPNNTGNSPGNGNPYDGDDDVLVGIINNSGSPLVSIPLTSSDLTFGGIFGFDGDGPCDYLFQLGFKTSQDCYSAAVPAIGPEPDPVDYEGPNNTFTVGPSVACTTTENDLCYPSGTVAFVTAIPPAGEECGPPTCNTTWFALEGTPNSLVLTSEMQTLTFPPSNTPQTQTATFGTGDAQHTVAFTIPTVNTTFNVTETANYVDTEFSTPGNQAGIGIADGVCEANSPNNGTLNGVIQYPDNDIDCRLAAGGFVYATINGDQVVPHAFPYHNGQAVWYRASTNGVAQSQVPVGQAYNYVGPVTDAWTWEENPPLVNGVDGSPANPEYAPGWNNENGRVYDRPGTLPNSMTANQNNAFTADITTFFQGCCGAGGKQPTMNDWVIAAIPNPQTGGADQEITLLPLPVPFGPSPAPYIKGLPMPVSFTLLNTTTKKLDPKALTFPNTVNISTQDSHGNTIPLQFPNGLPTTFQCVTVRNVCTGVYGIILSSTPYLKGQIYNMQIGSDLFSAPVNIPFVVK